MKLINTRHAVAVLKLGECENNCRPLIDEMGPFIDQTPHHVLDLEGALVNSIQIGELANVAELAQQRWGSLFHGFYMLHLCENGQKLIESAHLEEYFRIVPSLEVAIQAVDSWEFQPKSANSVSRSGGAEPPGELAESLP